MEEEAPKAQRIDHKTPHFVLNMAQYLAQIFFNKLFGNQI